jgi:hypothetical protein
LKNNSAINFSTTNHTNHTKNKEQSAERQRVDSLREFLSCFEKALASKLADAFAKHLPTWQANRNPVSF